MVIMQAIYQFFWLVVLTKLFQLLLGMIIVEHIISGLHTNYWTVKMIEKVLEVIEIKGGIGGPIYEFLTCKFCQSWWAGWLVAWIMLFVTGDYSWNWVWMGIVMSSGANAIHAVKDWLKALKYIPFGGKTVSAKGDH